MEVPGVTDPLWVMLVTRERVCELRFLAARILLGRLLRCVSEDDSPENVQQCAAQIHAIFANNVNAPSVQDDLKTLLG